MAYNPSVPPATPDDLLPYLQEEFFRVSQSFNPLLTGEHEILYKLPIRFKPGLVCYFDGVEADPLGTGQEGLYRYSLAGVWVYIG